MFDNGLGDGGSARFLEALRFNTALRKLSLSKNGITGEGLKGVLAAFRRCPESAEVTTNRTAVEEAVTAFNEFVAEWNKNAKKNKAAPMEEAIPPLGPITDKETGQPVF